MILNEKMMFEKNDEEIKEWIYDLIDDVLFCEEYYDNINNIDIIDVSFYSIDKILKLSILKYILKYKQDDILYIKKEDDIINLFLLGDNNHNTLYSIIKEEGEMNYKIINKDKSISIASVLYEAGLLKVNDLKSKKTNIDILSILIDEIMAFEIKKTLNKRLYNINTLYRYELFSGKINKLIGIYDEVEYIGLREIMDSYVSDIKIIRSNTICIDDVIEQNFYFRYNICDFEDMKTCFKVIRDKETNEVIKIDLKTLKEL